MGNIPQNGFQGVPERICVYTDAMLANRRSRSRLPLRGSMAALAAHCKEHRAHKHHRHKVQQQGKQIKLLFLLLYRLGNNLWHCVGCCGASVFLLLKLFAACTVLF